MKYTKYIVDGYILAVGNGGMGIEISEEEYEHIMTVIHNKPTPTESMDYRLTTELTWEPFEIYDEESEEDYGKDIIPD